MTAAAEAIPAYAPTLAEIQDAAMHAIAHGAKPRKVEAELARQFDLSPDEARLLVDQARRDARTHRKSHTYLTAKRNKCLRHLAFGSLWCIGGTIVTAATYSAASDGGTYVVAWGAIVIGGIEALYGLLGTLAYSLRAAAA